MLHVPRVEVHKGSGAFLLFTCRSVKTAEGKNDFHQDSELCIGFILQTQRMPATG